jgi:hypothetical protein
VRRLIATTVPSIFNVDIDALNRLIDARVEAKLAALGGRG